MKTQSFKTLFSVVLAGVVLASLIAGTVFAMAGPPTRPSAGPAPDASLAVHPLTFAGGPLDNPVKGFAPFFFKRTNYESKPLPHSMIWSYFAMSEVMTSATDCNFFDWAILEQALDETASTGRHGVFRFYVEYPGGSGTHPANGIPPCLNGKVTMRTNGFWGTTSPDYDDPDLIQAFTNFINALASHYDGDPRVGYIHMGLVGLWGEWHTWPYDRDTADGYPNLFPTDQTLCTLINAYDAAFSQTKLEIRYPDLACGTAANIGHHDDSWPYKEFRQGTSEAKGMTLPISMGGWPDAFLERSMNGAAENKWINHSIGGEVRPEIQSGLPGAWPNGAGQVDNVKAAIELGHFTWSINEQGVGGYNPTDPNVQAIIRTMGYELFVKNAYFNSGSGGSLKVGVQIENRGTARFYYPWTVILGVKDGSGNVVQTWNTPWDITLVQPLQIRAFPDWNVGADPTYLPFGHPLYYDTTVSTNGLSGTYTLVMRVRNSLESVTEASVRDNIETWQPFLPAKKFRFANAAQNADGWLSLGSVNIGSCGSCPTPTVTRTFTPAPATSTFTPLPPTNTPTRTSTPTVGPSPTPPPTQTSTPVGFRSYEAESTNNTLAGGAAIMSCSGCSNNGKVGWVGNNQGTLQFNGVSPNAAGNHTLTIYYTNGDASRTAQVSVNGGGGVNLTFPSTGGWEVVGSINTTISLNAGSNTIKFSNPVSGSWAPDFDRITIAPTGGPTPTPPPTATKTNTPVPPTNTPAPPTNTPTWTNTPSGPTNTPTRTNTPAPPTNTPTRTNTPSGPTNTPTRTNTPSAPTNTPTHTPTPGSGTSYEAEAAGNTRGGGATIQNCTACSGGQRVDSIGWGINNAYLIFNNVNVATAGNRTVTVYYTNGNNTSLTFHADPNGASGPTTTVPSNGGYDWTQPVLSVNITLNLNAGNNTIRIWDNNKAPDIDRIVVQ